LINWKGELAKWLVDKDAHRDVVNYEAVKKLPADATWDLLIVDEAHYVKNGKAARTKLVRAIAKRCRRKLLLTGTPIMNKPVELWSLLQIAAPEEWDPAGMVKRKPVGPGEGAGFFRFAKRYCDAHEERVSKTKVVWNFDGASNLPELQDKLRGSCMVRRLKRDVLSELPAKRRSLVGLDCQASRGEQRFAHVSPEQMLTAPALEFKELSLIRHESALAKVPAAVEYLKNALETGEKLVVFCHHKDVAQLICEGIESVLPPVTGDMGVEDRQACVTKFQSEPEVQVIVGTYGAMGVGHTLTASSRVITIEQVWVPAELTQAEDRCHRIGQANSVSVEHLVTPGSLDARMVELILIKQEIADMALDTVTPEPVAVEMVRRQTPPTVQISAEEIASIHDHWSSQTLPGLPTGARAKRGQRSQTAAGARRLGVSRG
jgi:SWI/SNF-related matrix-associated actin-dependent regulator 1 of chromatin subfamily A